jgi:hypothetical protein
MRAILAALAFNACVAAGDAKIVSGVMKTAPRCALVARGAAVAPGDCHWRLICVPQRVHRAQSSAARTVHLCPTNRHASRLKRCSIGPCAPEIVFKSRATIDCHFACVDSRVLKGRVEKVRRLETPEAAPRPCSNGTGNGGATVGSPAVFRSRQTMRTNWSGAVPGAMIGLAFLALAAILLLAPPTKAFFDARVPPPTDACN